MKKNCFLLIVFLVSTTFMSQAFALPVTVSTGDLGNNAIYDAGSFQVNLNAETPSNTIASTLVIKYGLYDSPNVAVSVFFNSTLIGSFLADQGYISPGPSFAEFTITNLLLAGMNNILFDGFGLNTGAYVIGQVDLNYDNSGTAPVPEPATILLLGAGLIGVAFCGRKKF